jgi:hypothetical protein
LLGAFTAVQAKLDRVIAQVDNFGLGARSIYCLNRDRNRLVGDAIIAVGTIDYQYFARRLHNHPRARMLICNTNPVLMQIKCLGIDREMLRRVA